MAQAITREEQYLAAMASGGSTDIKPVTREEMYLAKAAGQNVNVPEPVTRKEMFLQQVALNGGGSSAVLKHLSVVKNGNYLATSYGADGFSSVGVDVQGGIIEVAQLPTENIDTDAFYLYNGEYYRWSNTFSFNDTLSLPTGSIKYWEVPFTTSNNATYEAIRIDEKGALQYVKGASIYTVYSDGNWGRVENQKLTFDEEITDASLLSLLNGNGTFWQKYILEETQVEDTLTEFLKVRGGRYLFNNCTQFVNASDVPLFDASVLTDADNMFNDCANLTEIPQFDASNITGMNYTFNSCRKLTTMPFLDTKKVKSAMSMFGDCRILPIIPALDMRLCTSMTSMFNECREVTDIQIRNIKTNLKVSNGTSYGHLLTVDSLIHLIYELRNTGSAKTLTIGSANLEKLANVYVKAVEITDDMRAEDDLIDEKYPFVVCESTDEGATLITDYASDMKMWTIA